MESKVKVDADHSEIVKFRDKHQEPYVTAIRYLRSFEETITMVMPPIDSPEAPPPAVMNQLQTQATDHAFRMARPPQAEEEQIEGMEYILC